MEIIKIILLAKNQKNHFPFLRRRKNLGESPKELFLSKNLLTEKEKLAYIALVGIPRRKKTTKHEKHMESINMKGQPRAVDQARAFIASIERGGPIRPVLLHGPAGVGKTHLTREIVGALEPMGFEPLIIDSAADICRTVADCAKNLLEPLTDGARRAIVIDEAHLLRGGNGTSAAVAAAFKAALLPLGGAMPTTTPFPLYAGEAKYVHWTDVALILATNVPDRLEEPASLRNGERPFRRRLRSIELSPYGDDVIGEVISDYLTSKNLRAADCSRGIIARFHRGTLAAISEVVGQYQDLYPDQPVMSKERVLAAAKLTQFFPRGLNRAEVRLLAALVRAGGCVKRTLAAATIGCSPAELIGALAHLSAQINAKGEPTPFIQLTGTVVGITESGSKYLAAVQKEGFTI